MPVRGLPVVFTTNTFGECPSSYESDFDFDNDGTIDQSLGLGEPFTTFTFSQKGNFASSVVFSCPCAGLTFTALCPTDVKPSCSEPDMDQVAKDELLSKPGGKSYEFGFLIKCQNSAAVITNQQNSENLADRCRMTFSITADTRVIGHTHPDFRQGNIPSGGIICNTTPLFPSSSFTSTNNNNKCFSSTDRATVNNSVVSGLYGVLRSSDESTVLKYKKNQSVQCGTEI